MSILPSQKTTEAEKLANKGIWGKTNVDNFIRIGMNYSDNTTELDELYNAAAGILKASAYQYILNPHNDAPTNIKNLPAQMRNMDIIGPVIKLFLGEKSERPSVFQVIVTNADSPNKKKASLDGKVIAMMAQDFVNNLNANGIPTGVPSQQISGYDQAIEEHNSNWNDERAIIGQEALDYIMYNCDMDDKKQDLFFDWLVAGRCYSYKEVYRDDVYTEVVPPFEMRHGTTETGFVEDADWAHRRRRMSVASVLDRWRSDLDRDALTWLDEQLTLGTLPNNVPMVTTSMSADETLDKKLSNDIYINRTTGMIDVWHVQWKTWVKIGILQYVDEYGYQQEMEVDDTYVLEKEHGDISIEWEWVNKVWEGTRIGQFIYVDIGESLCQRNELSNSSKCKLNYNGRVDKFPSPVKILMNYQALFNIYHYRRELTLARNKDKIMMMPIGLIPEQFGGDPVKFMYHIEATSVAWFDETKPNAAAILQAIRGIDLGLGNYVAEMTNLLAEIKAEAWDAIGLNRQRYGDSKASDGKGVNEQAVYRSAIISLETYRRFEKFEEKENQGLLDISKVAWINGKKGAYINSDRRMAFLEINGLEHLESSYGVFAKNSSKENQKLEIARQAALNIAQKGTSPYSTVLESIDSNNFSKLKEIVKKAEKIDKEYQAQVQEKQNEALTNVQQMKNENDDKNRSVKIYEADRNYAAMVDSVSIKVQGDLAVGIGNQEGTEPNADFAKEQDATSKRINEMSKRRLEGLNSSMESVRDSTNARLKERDLDLKDKKIVSDEKIARTNKNKYD